MSTIKKLNTYMLENGISQEAVGRSIGYSATTVNQVISGKYKGNLTAIEKAIKEFLDTVAEKKQVQHSALPAFVQTSTASKMLEVIRAAHVDGDINVIHGQAGLGKTMALRAYCERYSQAVLIETDPGYTARALLEVICESLGLNSASSGTLHTLSSAIVKRLRNSGYVLLIDEAENLPLRALEALRRIHDKTGVGIVLAGMPRLLVNLRGKRGELAQLYSRVGFALPLGNELPRDDVLEIVSHLTDVEAVAGALADAAKGNARRLSKLMRRVQRVSQINSTHPTVGIVRDCAKALID